MLSPHNLLSLYQSSITLAVAGDLMPMVASLGLMFFLGGDRPDITALVDWV